MSKIKLNSAKLKQKISLIFSRPVRGAITITLLLILIGFIGKQHNQRQIEDIAVEVLNEDDNFFLDDVDVLNIMTLDGSEFVLGQMLEEIDIKKLENRLNRNPYLSRSEVYADLKGKINVKVWMKKPIARIIPNTGAQLYICEGRTLMPLSDRYSSRVMLIRGDGVKFIQNEDSLTTPFGMQFLSLIESIDSDPFLQAQIAEIEVQKNKELLLYPQVTKQKIAFGDLSDVDIKIKKLNIFYKDILPTKGWNNYEMVSLKFKNQIVCE